MDQNNNQKLYWQLQLHWQHLQWQAAERGSGRTPQQQLQRQQQEHSSSKAAFGLFANDGLGGDMTAWTKQQSNNIGSCSCSGKCLQWQQQNTSAAMAEGSSRSPAAASGVSRDCPGRVGGGV